MDGVFVMKCCAWAVVLVFLGLEQETAAAVSCFLDPVIAVAQ